MKALAINICVAAVVAVTSLVGPCAAQEDGTSRSTSSGIATSTSEPQQTATPQVPQPAVEKDCDCYVTNGSNPIYLEKRMFYDFRSLSKHTGVPDVSTDADEATEQSPSSKYFKSKDWKKHWKLSDWTNGVSKDDPLIIGEHVPRVYSPGNVYIEENDDRDADSETYMTLRTKRVPDFQSCGEFSSAEEFQFLSLRVLARTVGDFGGVTSIFTYRRADELEDIQEADIEFLTREADDRVHYVNNPAYTYEGENFPEATRNTTIPQGKTFSDWLIHRFDWTPERSIWYIEGNETASIAFQVPRDPSRIVFNVWSDGGFWSGNMSMNDETFLHVKWIEMIYNTTDPSDGNCSAVCSIDENGETDAIMLLWDSPASHMSRPGWFAGGRAGALTWVVTALVIITWSA